ncbi:MAG: tRNA (adenosine(37)-N6)-threonylcarbamoyltransferase complex dimerization subunit type 1 TsaB [Candidatus Binatia bacterium]
MSSSSSKPYLLALDTSSTRAGAALAGPGGEILAESALEVGHGRGEALAGCVRDILEQTQIAIDAVGTLAVARGPGSFTGTRIGLAMARGLALVDDLPVVGIDSLELLVHSAGDVDTRLCAVIAAGHDRLYMAGYQRDDTGRRCTRPPAVISFSELDPAIAEWGGRVVLCAERETLDRVRAEQAAKRPDRLVAVPEVRARFLAELATTRLDSAEPAAAVLPVYVAETAARPNRNRVVASPGAPD